MACEPANAAVASTFATANELSSEDGDAEGDMPVWEVIGGGRNSGLQVRTGQSLSSAVASSRLATGALVRERELLGNRLHYKLLSGTGPSSGWVTISLGNKALLVRKGQEPDEDKAAGSGDTGDEAGAATSSADEACGCVSCQRPMRWSNFSEGDYAEGWDCNNLPNCGNGSFNHGAFRWFCDRCQVDVCGPCFQERRAAFLRIRVGEAAEDVAREASPPLSARRRASSCSHASRASRRSRQEDRSEQAPRGRPHKFALDHPLSQAEGRARCLASDTVAGNIQRLAELQDRNASLEASQARWEVERGLLLAKVEQLEGMLRRSGRSAQPDVGLGVARGRCPSPDVEGSEASGGVGEAGEVKDSATVELSVAVERPSGSSAVTCLCFGQERHYVDHVLLAVAHADGLAVLYRCVSSEQRTSSPLGAGFTPLFPRMDAGGGDGGTGSLPSHPWSGRASASSSSPTAGTRGGELTELRRLTGHTRGIMAMSFDPLEEQLLTASHDRSLRIWDVASGELRAVFTDASLVEAAAFLPWVPGTFVVSVLGARPSGHPGEADDFRPMRHSSRRASLRLASAQTSSVLHALPAASDVHALCFDSTGRVLLAGTQRSTLLAIEVSAAGDRLLPRMRVPLGVGKVTSISRASSGSSGRQRVLIASEGKESSSVTMVECVYAAKSAGGHLLSITGQREVSISNKPLPCRGCYSPFGPGLLISGSSHGGLLMRSLDSPKLRRMAAPHGAAVVAAASSSRGTLVASADAKGTIVVWRCQSMEAPEPVQEPEEDISESGDQLAEPEAVEEALKKPAEEPVKEEADAPEGAAVPQLKDSDEEAAIARAAARKARRDAKVQETLADRPPAKELQAACRPALLDREPGEGRLWIVVGGGAKGGILVRSCENLTSMVYRTRLMTGATVEELRLVGNRLHYRRVRGDGPESGWVKLSYGGEPLLELQETEARSSQM